MRRQHGLGLLEFLVSVAILSFATLALLSLQMRALNNTEYSYYNQQALMLLQSVGQVPSNSQQFILNWQQQVNNLPKGRGQLDRTVAIISWEHRHYGRIQWQFTPIWQ